jgi:hypothetical protein
MSTPIFMSVPARDQALIDEIERELSPYVHPQPGAYRDLETVKLVLDIVGQVVSIGGGVAGVLAFLQNTRDRAAKDGKKTGIVLSKPGGPVVSLDTDDDALLRQLLGIDE